MAKTIKAKCTSLTILATLLLAILLPIFPIRALADGTNGFIADEARVKYNTAKVVEDFPNTFEIVLRVSTDFNSACSVIASYVDRTMCTYSLSIDANGHPSFTVYGDIGEATTAKFDNVDVRTGEFIHLAVVIADTEARCYVDGELKSTKTVDFPNDVRVQFPTTVGGSYSRSYLNAEILTLAAFDSARSGEEIVADMNGVPSGDDLLYSYDFSGFDNSNARESIADLSGNQNDLEQLNYLYDEPVNPPTDYAYSFALVGDIQFVNLHNPENLHLIYDWIIDNKDEKKIEFAINLGDITDKNTEREWDTAYEVIHSLDGKLPYSIVRGNHDKNIEAYTSRFDYEYYKNLGTVDGSFDQTMLNTYKKIELCGNKYLILNLDFKNTEKSIEWANEVVRQHHDYNVIVTTHIYIGTSGVPLNKQNSTVPANAYGAKYDGDKLWDVFLSKHKNITAVICGHITSQTVLTTYKIGDHGNKVAQILVDPQGFDLEYEGGLGMVAMLYFNEDGTLVQTQYYSTIQEKYFVPHNERAVELDPIQKNGSVPNNHSYTYEYDDDGHWQVCACGDKMARNEHTLGEWVIVREATEEKRGMRYALCECGHRHVENYDYEPPIEEPDEPKERSPIIITAILIAGIAIIVGGTIAGSFIFLKKKKVDEILSDDLPTDKE